MKHTQQLVLSAFISMCLVALFGCGSSSDDDGGDTSSTPTSSGGEASSDATGGTDTSARPALARILVCSEATGPVTVSINGDTLEDNRLSPGGELFARTVLGNVTFDATASGVTFTPVTVNMVDSMGDNAQTIQLNCTATAPATPNFSDITPSGLDSDLFTIAGRGTVVTATADAVEGATSYTFTLSTGMSMTVSMPSVGFEPMADPLPAGASLTVFATNADGQNTRSATLDF